jgi:hypothetical protein
MGNVRYIVQQVTPHRYNWVVMCNGTVLEHGVCSTAWWGEIVARRAFKRQQRIFNDWNKS